MISVSKEEAEMLAIVRAAYDKCDSKRKHDVMLGFGIGVVITDGGYPRDRFLKICEVAYDMLGPIYEAIDKMLRFDSKPIVNEALEQAKRREDPTEDFEIGGEG